MRSIKSSLGDTAGTIIWDVREKGVVVKIHRLMGHIPGHRAVDPGNEFLLSLLNQSACKSALTPKDGKAVGDDEPLPRRALRSVVGPHTRALAFVSVRMPARGRTHLMILIGLDYI